MKLSTYTNEFYTHIGKAKPRIEKCDNGHFKAVGKNCEACEDAIEKGSNLKGGE